MQNRADESDYARNNLTSPNSTNVFTNNRRKSLLLLHNSQDHTIRPRSSTLDRIVSTSNDNESSSSSSDDQSLFNFRQRSIDKAETTKPKDLPIPSPKEPLTPRSPSTLDRSRLKIPLAFSFANLPSQQPLPKSISKEPAETISSAGSIEDIAQIDTELKLTLLSQESENHINPLLYSKGILNRHIAFRSISKKDFKVISNKQETHDRSSSTDSFSSAHSTCSNTGLC